MRDLVSIVSRVMSAPAAARPSVGVGHGPPTAPGYCQSSGTGTTWPHARASCHGGLVVLASSRQGQGPPGHPAGTLPWWLQMGDTAKPGLGGVGKGPENCCAHGAAPEAGGKGPTQGCTEESVPSHGGCLVAWAPRGGKQDLGWWEQAGQRCRAGCVGKMGGAQGTEQRVQHGAVGVGWAVGRGLCQGCGMVVWAGMGGGWAHPGLGAATSGRGVSRATVAIATLLRSYHRQEKSSFIINTDLPKLTLVCPLGSNPVLAQLGAASHPCLAWLP